MPASASAAAVAWAAICGYGSLAPGLVKGIMPMPATYTSRLMVCSAINRLERNSRDIACAALPEAFAQARLKYLTRTGQRQLVDELDAARTLVAGNQRLAVMDDVVGRQ